MARNGGPPRLLAKCGSAVEVLDEQQIEDPAFARVKRARTTGHTDSLPAVARTQLGKWPPASLAVWITIWSPGSRGGRRT